MFSSKIDFAPGIDSNLKLEFGTFASAIDLFNPFQPTFTVMYPYINQFTLDSLLTGMNFANQFLSPQNPTH